MARPRRKLAPFDCAPLNGVFAALASVPPAGAGEPLDDACKLFHEILALFQESGDPARECHRLFLPLSRVVAAQRSRRAQEDCAQVFIAVVRGNEEAALDASRRLIEREAARN